MYRSTVPWIRIGFMRIRIHYFRSICILVPILGVGDQNCNILQLKKYPIFYQKSQDIIPKPPWRTSKLQKEPPALNREHMSLNNNTFLHFFLFFIIFAHLDVSGSYFLMRIRIQQYKINADPSEYPDPQHCTGDSLQRTKSLREGERKALEGRPLI